MMKTLPFRSITIVGSGLLGTSLGLALAEKGVPVMVEDLDERRAAIGKDLLRLTGDKNFSGKVEIKAEGPPLYIIAVSPGNTARVISTIYSRDSESRFIEITGIKFKLIPELQSFNVNLSQVLSVHPMAGREISGPEGARSDLFSGRIWIASPFESSESELVLASQLICEVVESHYIELEAVAHDRAISLVSQLPQLLSSALGKMLIGRSSEVEFAGQGLRDMVRLAGSDSKLWSDLFDMNRPFILKELSQYIDILTKWREVLATGKRDEIAQLLIEGSQGRELIPGKHGGKSRDYASIAVVIDDRTGQLGDLFVECGNAEINVEDLNIEHSPGQATGLITLFVNSEHKERLLEHLKNSGWKAH